jgi:hypothetical protein
LPRKPTGRDAGRPTKLTPEVQDLLVEALKTGAHITTAAYHAKVHPNTIWKWLKLGKEDPNGPWGEFRGVIMGAIHEAELRFVAIIAQAAQHNPEHAKWMVTHRHPKRWADRSKLQVSAKVSGGLALLSDEEMAGLGEEALKVLRARDDEG